jgi:phage-related protein (TIGR01555 family)
MFRKKKPAVEEPKALPYETEKHETTTLEEMNKQRRKAAMDAFFGTIQRVEPRIASKVTVQDDAGYGRQGESISDTQLSYFGAKGFIGYQTCAILSQHWLIDAACTIPMDDAIRKGWTLTVTNAEIEPDKKQRLDEFDERIKFTQRMQEFGKFGRVYGIRVAVFLVENADADFYQLPFNWDSVKPGSYKGILMNDPYYCIPILDGESLDMNSLMFYEPTYWLIGGVKYHHTHCEVFIHSDVPQILKPTYLYGGVSLTQQIFDAVYNAEISANEIPQLLQTMRQEVLHTDISQVVLNQGEIIQSLETITALKNNYGTRLIGTDDNLEQMTTSLNGLDELVAGRYKIVAAVAQMPVAKLMKTDLTGGLVKGGGEESIYHETLEVIQVKLMRFLRRHYRLAELSLFGTSTGLTATFEKPDAMTQNEKLEAEKIKTDIDEANVAMGAISGDDVRARHNLDKESIYFGKLSGEAPDKCEDDDG